MLCFYFINILDLLAIVFFISILTCVLSNQVRIVMLTLREGNIVLSIGLFFPLLFLVPYVGFLSERIDYSAYPDYEVLTLGSPQIGKLNGPLLALRDNPIQFDPIELRAALTVTQLPARPGAQEQNAYLEMKIIKTGENKRVYLGQRVYFDLNSHNYLKFADKPTALSVLPNFLEKGVLCSTMYIKVQDSPLKEKAVRFSLKKASTVEEKKIKNMKRFKDFAQILWNEPDRLKELMNSEQVDSYRLSIDGEEHEIKPGQYLIKSSGLWRVKVPDDNPKAPLIQFVRVEGKKMVLRAWPENEQSGVEFKVSRSKSASLIPSFEKQIRDVRLKSKQSITCRIGKEFIKARVGDWVLARNKTWTVLNSKESIEQYLAGELSGSLFIIQKIVSDKGQKTLEGYLFNPDRTERALISVPITRKLAAKNKSIARTSKPIKKELKK